MPHLASALFLSAIAWAVFFGWLRHRSWLRHRDSGFAPGTQGLSLVGSVGAFLLVLTATLCFVAPASLPSVATEAVPPPAKLSAVMERGSNLRAVGAGAYGHERFSGSVAALNGISEPERVQAGVTLKTPSLSIAFRDVGLDPRYQPAINVLAKACTDFYGVFPEYRKARYASGIASGTFAIPQHIRTTFLRCAGSIDAALRVLDAVKSPHAVPRMTINQFRQASAGIRDLAAGMIDGYGYDYNMVGQRFGLGFENAIIWVQHHHQ